QDLPVGQHGDDDLGARCGLGGGGGRGHALDLRGGQVEACDLMPGGGQVAGHRAAPVAPADKSDLHVQFSHVRSWGPRSASMAATASGSAGADQFGLRSLSMIWARTPSRKSLDSVARWVKRYSRLSESWMRPSLRAARTIASVAAIDRGELRRMGFSESSSPAASSAAVSSATVSASEADRSRLASGPGGG